jgi:hypothetical protein
MPARKLSVLLLVAALLACLPALAQKEMTKLSIVVLDPKDRPVPKASVTVTFVSGSKMYVKKVRAEWNTKTSSKGVADLPDMPPGKVRLQVIASGFQTHGEEFQISGKEFTHTVKLKRSSGSQYSAHEPTEPAPEKPPEKPKPQ